MQGSAASWLEVCREFAARSGVAPDLVDVLGAFRSPDPRGGPPPAPEVRFDGEFSKLEAELLARDPFSTIGDLLTGEVDPDQARMFGRRLHSVDAALGSIADASGRVLRVGLRVRVDGISSAAGPRALRLRALADFYYSQLGRHLHRRAGGPALEQLIASLHWSSVSAGLEHARLDGPSELGPVHVNLLRIDPAVIRVEVQDCRDAVEQGLEFAAYTRALGAVAAVSGGFFLYSEPDIIAPSARYDPVGLLLTRGELCSPPIFKRGSVLVGEDGAVEITQLGLEAVRVRLGTHELAGLDAITRAHARVGPPQPSVAIVGSRVVATGSSLAVPLNGFVLPTPAQLDAQPGTPVSYAPLLSPCGAPLRCGVAGGPMLLESGRPTLDMRGEDFWGSAPPVTFSQDETGDRNLLPRLAAGLDAHGHLVLAAVDGRNFDRALGMTLAEVGQLMQLLGCVCATNLDGGSSKRMVVRGDTLDLSTTEIATDHDGVAACVPRVGARAQRIRAEGTPAQRVRPVHTAVLLFER